MSLVKACLKAGLLSGCLVFLYFHLDFKAICASLAQYSGMKAAMLSLWFLTSFLLLGARLYVIAHGQLRLKDSIAAVFMGFFANSILPARVGESIKGLYLKFVSKKTMHQILTVVFWERFSDLNMLLILVALLSVIGGANRFLLPISAFTLLVWGALIFVHFRYRSNDAKLNKIRFPVIQKIIRHLSAQPDNVTIFKLVALNLLVWGQFILEMLIAIYWIAGLDIPLGSAMNIFLISSLAFAIPASPGGVGLYDAAIVFSMGHYGINAADAMAFAILMRTIQYVPTLLIGCIMILAGGSGLQVIFRPSSARKMMPALEFVPKNPTTK